MQDNNPYDGRNDLKKDRVVSFEAEQQFEYFEKDAIEKCHELLQEKIENYLYRNNITNPSEFKLSEIENNVDHEWMIDEYSCKCKQLLIFQ